MNRSLAERADVLLDLVPRDGHLPDFLLRPAAGDLATAVDLVGGAPLPTVSPPTCASCRASAGRAGPAAGRRMIMRFAVPSPC
ncbi:hypothetical protein PV410_24530 [Streptomyces sp. PA03-5A]|nr:hypothetical protein [Streptomyces sp. PA03-5A]